MGAKQTQSLEKLNTHTQWKENELDIFSDKLLYTSSFIRCPSPADAAVPSIVVVILDLLCLCTQNALSAHDEATMYVCTLAHLTMASVCVCVCMAARTEPNSARRDQLSRRCV